MVCDSSGDSEGFGENWEVVLDGILETKDGIL